MQLIQRLLSKCHMEYEPHITEVTSTQKERTRQIGAFLYLGLKLEGQVARRWNTFYPSLLLIYEKLSKLGFVYYNGQVSIIESEDEDA